MTLYDWAWGQASFGLANANMYLAKLRPLPALADVDLSNKQIIITGSNTGQPLPTQGVDARASC